MERRPSRRTLVATIAIGGLAVLVVAGLVFQPWRLIIDTEVRDADPFLATTPTSAGPAAAPASTTPTTAPAAPTSADPGSSDIEPTDIEPADVAPTTGPPPPVRVGSFRSIAHQTSGNVRVGPTPDGRQVVYLEDLATDNGPDVRVFLSPHPPEGDDSVYGTDELELGPLKGNIGNQTYEVPAGTDLSRYQSVVLWCERFSVGFGVAGLTAI